MDTFHDSPEQFIQYCMNIARTPPPWSDMNIKYFISNLIHVFLEPEVDKNVIPNNDEWR